jgi:hypothetical protein
LSPQVDLESKYQMRDEWKVLVSSKISAWHQRHSAPGLAKPTPPLPRPTPPNWLYPPPLEKGDRRGRVARLDLGARYSGNTTKLCSRFEMHARRMPVLRSQLTMSRMFVIPLCPSFFFLLLGLVEVDFVLSIDAYLGIYTAKKP